MQMSDLDDLFAEARANPPDPSPALVARVLADADRLQPKPAAPVAAPATRGFLAGLAAFFGGGAALAGIGSAAVAGLFLGLVQPAILTSFTASIAQADTLDTLDLMPGVDALLSGE